MIISHSRKYVFVKTMKTAGTSLEVALSCGLSDGDLLSRNTDEEEKLRKRWGGLPHTQGRINQGHSPITFARGLVAEDAWPEYFRFCVERNPWDKTLSYYWWMNKHHDRFYPETLDDILRRKKAPSNWDLYTENGQIAVDRVLRYEDLTEELQSISDRVGLDMSRGLPRCKGTTRKDRRPYREVLSDRQAEQIAEQFSREIEAFGYTY